MQDVPDVSRVLQHVAVCCDVLHRVAVSCVVYRRE